jgi:Ser/Thr protein kinase RdoA (MazF antagonist)
VSALAGPQRGLAEAQLRRIVAAAYGTDDVFDSATRLAGGSVNTSYALRMLDGSSAILRVAPSDAAAAAGPSWLTPWGLRREAAVMALAADLHSLFPVTLAHDFQRTVFDRDWVLQSVMPGAPFSAVDATLPLDERTTLWSELGTITRRLHSVRGDAFGPPVHGERFDRWSDLLAHDARGLIDDAGRFALPSASFQRLLSMVEDLASVLDDGIRPQLVHSDLARSHVFVDRTNEGPYRITGIIDLEFGRFADPQMERLITSFRWGNAPVEMAPWFFRGYGQAFDTREDHLRLHIYVAIALGWSATILGWHGRRDALPGVMSQLDDVLTALEHLRMS